MSYKLKLTLLTMLVVVALSACGSKKDSAGGTTAVTPAPTAATGGTATVSPAPTAATGGSTTATVDAQAIFKQNCVACHGDNLEGKLGPNTNLTKIGATKTKEQITNQIHNGGGGMPPFGSKLKDQEISALADWLSAKK